MATSKPIVTNEYDGAEQPAVQSKDAAPPRRRMNIQMVQNVLLVGVDISIDEDSADCPKTMTQLRRAVNNINKYTDDKQCIEFLQSTENENTCMVISDSLGRQVVPQVHNLSQVDFIFILCSNTEFYEQWTKEWPKIKGVFAEIGQTCEALKKAVRQREQDSMPISIIPIDDDVSQKRPDQLEPSFMYTEILKEILLSMEFEEQHFDEFIQHCRKVFADSEFNLKKVKQFEKDYRNRKPIWWYTSSSFQYSMLNNALRMMDANVIINMAFFISDLHRNIEQLHQEEFGSGNSGEIFAVYRGQGLSKVDFEQLSKAKGGLLSFNNFLSTTKKQDVALTYTQRALNDVEMVQVLFVMTVDPAQSNTPFASITDVSYFGDDEDEVLFSMHTVFRIGEITSMDENSCLFQVKLTLTSDNDKELQILTDHIRIETAPHATGWHRLAEVLIKIGYSDKAQQISETLVKQATDEEEKAHSYDNLGSAHINNGEYQEAITCYEKSLEIFKKTRPKNDSILGVSYSNIGNVYHRMGDYPNALSSYEKAVAIEQQSFRRNIFSLADYYNNIGNLHVSMNNYPKALSSLEKALEIQQQLLPPTHPNLAHSYVNIGNVCRGTGDGPKALSFYKKALAIQQQSLPSNHPDLAVCYNNIGLMYMGMGDYPKALSSYEKALTIQQKLLPPNHSDLAFPLGNIGLVYFSIGDYSKALSSLEKALAIQQKSLLPNSPLLAEYHDKIGLVYDSMNDYPKALSSLEKALVIRQQSFPPNPPHLASSYNSIGLVYGSMGDYTKALSSLEDALTIRRQILPPYHPDLASSHSSIGLIYEKMKNFSKACWSYQRAVDIARQLLPLGLQIYRNNLEDVKRKL